jgi:hypothetical protein
MIGIYIKMRGISYMKEDIQKIRELLDKIEGSIPGDLDESFREEFGLFELPEIFSSIVDYLQPLLLPYEAAIYWFMFRHSIVSNGDVFVRASTRGMMRGVITSSSGQSHSLSLETVRIALTGLEKKVAIKKAGDTNRQGTLYRIFIPEEIEICRERMKEVQAKEMPKVDSRRELDFYNIRENRLKIFEKDGYKCYKCGKQLTRFSATLDHLNPVSEGGDNSYDNLATCCLHCNSMRGAKPISDLLP